MAKAPSVSSLKKRLWRAFATYVKNRDNWTCFTCGRRATGKAMNAGHFIPKSVGGLALYFHEDNVHAQCAYCNLVLEGNHYRYGVLLGPEKVAELDALRRVTTKWTRQDYLDRIALYESKCTSA